MEKTNLVRLVNLNLGGFSYTTTSEEAKAKIEAWAKEQELMPNTQLWGHVNSAFGECERTQFYLYLNHGSSFFCNVYHTQ